MLYYGRFWQWCHHCGQSIDKASREVGCHREIYPASGKVNQDKFWWACVVWSLSKYCGAADVYDPHCVGGRVDFKRLYVLKCRAISQRIHTPRWPWPQLPDIFDEHQLVEGGRNACTKPRYLCTCSGINGWCTSRLFTRRVALLPEGDLDVGVRCIPSPLD